MNITAFPDILLNSSQLDSESQAAFIRAWQRVDAEKGAVLAKAGEVCRHLYFIEKGLTRTFYFKDEKDITDWISIEGSFAVSIISFLTGAPDVRGIETLESSALWRIHHDDLEQLYARHPSIERFGRMLMTQGILQMQQRFDDLHFATAAERYRKLMQTTPLIIQRVPLSMVASYLGITQETLSRIRADRSF